MHIINVVAKINKQIINRLQTVDRGAERRWLFCELLLRVIWWKFTDVSEVLSASIIRHGSPSQRIGIFILVATRV
jgi:hypothetical protein